MLICFVRSLEATLVENWFVHSRSEYLPGIKRKKKLSPAPTEQDVLVISCLPMFFNCVSFLVSQMLKYKQADCVFPLTVLKF